MTLTARKLRVLISNRTLKLGKNHACYETYWTILTSTTFLCCFFLLNKFALCQLRITWECYQTCLYWFVNKAQNLNVRDCLLQVPCKFSEEPFGFQTNYNAVFSCWLFQMLCAFSCILIHKLEPFTKPILEDYKLTYT